MAYVYKITNNINQKSYIGKTLGTIKGRFIEHIKDSRREKNEQRPLYSAMNKYGVENFSIEELEQCSPEVVNDRETYWIESYGTFKNGYNATIGGDGRAYLDYDLVVSTYKETENQAEVARLMNIDVGTVRKILKEKEVKVLSNSEVNLSKLGKSVAMYDKNSKELLRVFPSLQSAANFLIENKYTNCKPSTARTHVSEVCHGHRKSASGFKWKFI